MRKTLLVGVFALFAAVISPIYSIVPLVTGFTDMWVMRRRSGKPTLPALFTAFLGVVAYGVSFYGLWFYLSYTYSAQRESLNGANIFIFFVLTLIAVAASVVEIIALYKWKYDRL